MFQPCKKYFINKFAICLNDGLYHFCFISNSEKIDEKNNNLKKAFGNKEKIDGVML